MKCPYCEKEVDNGFFNSAKWDYTWTPDRKSPRFIRNRPKEYEVLLKKEWNILRLSAYRCPNCRIIIIYKDDC